MARSSRLDAAERALRAMAEHYPEVREDHPWGHSAFKVRGKAFVFLAREDRQLSVTMKLPRSSVAADDLPFTEPTGYGLGKSGWVTCRFAPRDRVPLDLLEEWMEESFRAIAPKRLGATLDRDDG